MKYTKSTLWPKFQTNIQIMKNCPLSKYVYFCVNLYDKKKSEEIMSKGRGNIPLFEKYCNS